MKKAAILFNIILIFTILPVSGQVLTVTRITQSQNQWCWAGVSACVLEYYAKSVPQCVIAEYTRTVEKFNDISFGTRECCSFPSSCNNWNYNWGGAGSIEDILIHFAQVPTTKVSTFLTLAEITTAIQANRPFIIRWALTAGGGHFVVGHGISGENIYYMDPWPGEGKKIATYASVKSNAAHTWTHTNTCAVDARPPGNAGRITGSTTVCQGTSVTYTVPAIDRALTYLWTLPEGAKGTSTTESITVDFESNAISGAISVAGKNNLGTGTTSEIEVTVNPLPAPAGDITGPALVCQRQANVTYTVPEIENADSYIWEVDADATYTSSKNSITLNYGINTGTGSISVRGKNGCGDGMIKVLNIKLSGIPDTPMITQHGNELTSSAPVGNQWCDSNGPIAGATSQMYTITASGDYYVVVTIDGCSSEASETLNVILNGIMQPENLSSVTIYPNPVSDLLTIDTEGFSEPVRIKILNSLGQSLFQSIIINQGEIDLSTFAPGVYLINLESGKETQMRKIIRQ